jgi:hypothetical protein
MLKKIGNVCILTIHKGDLEYLKRTIRSVDIQSLQPIKHIILAKGICNYQIQSFKKENREFILNKNTDTSVYDGMNIIKKYSRNRITIYLNSGDILLSRNTLYYINKFNLFLNLNYVLVFTTLLRFKDIFFNIKDLFFKKETYLPHSSFLFKNNYFNKKIDFNIRFKITADGIWMKKIISRSRDLRKIFTNIVIQNLYGQSSMPSLKTCVWRWGENPLSGIKELLKLLISKLVPISFYFLIIFCRKYNFFRK